MIKLKISAPAFQGSQYNSVNRDGSPVIRPPWLFFRQREAGAEC
jgi:hypothetical protein